MPPVLAALNRVKRSFNDQMSRLSSLVRETVEENSAVARENPEVLSS